MKRFSAIFIALASVLLFQGVARAEPPVNVILLTLDGVRFQEFFKKNSNHFLFLNRPQEGFPVLWQNQSDSEKSFLVYGDPDDGEKMKISNPYAISLPGYQSIFAGYSQGERCKNNHCDQISVETFPERLVREAGFAKKDVASITSWEGISRASEQVRGTIFTNHSNQAIVDPVTGLTDDSELAALNLGQDQDRPRWYPSRFDRYTFPYGLWYLKHERPRFLHIGLNDSDEYGHENEYDHYIETLKTFDGYIQTLLQSLSQMGEYGENTVLIVTTDHGRGRNFFWRGHSKEFHSAKKVWTLIHLPKNLRSSLQKRKSSEYQHADLRPTIESLFGLTPDASLPGHSLLEEAQPAVATCGSSLLKGTVCLEKISELRPMQSAIGFKEVKKKAKKLSSLSVAEFNDYLISHPIPVIVGPGKMLALLDHHHLAASILKTEHESAVIEVVDNWETLSMADFWSAMIQNHYVYLKDSLGNPITPEQLPSSISALTDDPFRSLSGAVQDEGGFDKTSTAYYIEFTWALFFRNYIQADQIENDYKQAIKDALKIALSPVASSLPGYKGP